jgi:hypothetical protein
MAGSPSGGRAAESLVDSGGSLMCKPSTMLEQEAQRLGFREWLVSAIGSPQQMQIVGFINPLPVPFADSESNHHSPSGELQSRDGSLRMGYQPHEAGTPGLKLPVEQRIESGGRKSLFIPDESRHFLWWFGHEAA